MNKLLLLISLIFWQFQNVENAAIPNLNLNELEKRETESTVTEVLILTTTITDTQETESVVTEVLILTTTITDTREEAIVNSTATTSTPEQFTRETSYPKQVTTISSSPEEFTRETSYPEQITTISSSPEEFTRETSYPEQITTISSSPEEFTRETSYPEQITTISSSPEEFTRETSYPEQITTISSSPEEFTRETSYPEQITTISSSPEEFTRETSFPEQVTTLYSSPEQVTTSTSSSEPTISISTAIPYEEPIATAINVVRGVETFQETDIVLSDTGILSLVDVVNVVIESASIESGTSLFYTQSFSADDEAISVQLSDVVNEGLIWLDIRTAPQLDGILFKRRDQSLKKRDDENVVMLTNLENNGDLMIVADGNTIIEIVGLTNTGNIRSEATNGQAIMNTNSNTESFVNSGVLSFSNFLFNANAYITGDGSIVLEDNSELVVNGVEIESQIFLEGESAKVTFTSIASLCRLDCRYILRNFGVGNQIVLNSEIVSMSYSSDYSAWLAATAGGAQVILDFGEGYDSVNWDFTTTPGVLTYVAETPEEAIADAPAIVIEVEAIPGAEPELYTTTFVSSDDGAPTTRSAVVLISTIDSVWFTSISYFSDEEAESTETVTSTISAPPETITVTSPQATATVQETQTFTETSSSSAVPDGGVVGVYLSQSVSTVPTDGLIGVYLSQPTASSPTEGLIGVYLSQPTASSPTEGLIGVPDGGVVGVYLSQPTASSPTEGLIGVYLSQSAASSPTEGLIGIYLSQSVASAPTDGLIGVYLSQPAASSPTDGLFGAYLSQSVPSIQTESIEGFFAGIPAVETPIQGLQAVSVPIAVIVEGAPQEVSEGDALIEEEVSADTPEEEAEVEDEVVEVEGEVVEEEDSIALEDSNISVNSGSLMTVSAGWSFALFVSFLIL
ncbi:uncharacterized protein J8A68_001913, partial [[Candida] subhashii]